MLAVEFVINLVNALYKKLMTKLLEIFYESYQIKFIRLRKHDKKLSNFKAQSVILKQFIWLF